MIFSELTGRCGNQLFYYAVARAIQVAFYPEDKLYFNTHWIEKKADEYPTEHGWYNTLPEFSIKNTHFINPGEYCLSFYGNSTQKSINKIYSLLFYIHKNKSQKELHALERKVLPIAHIFGLYRSFYGYTYFIRSSMKHKFIAGYVFNPHFFSDIRDTLLDELRPIAPKPVKNMPLYEAMAAGESVCVTIRRRDFFSRGKESRRLCTAKYFVEAMSIIKQKIKKPTFIFFSDDIEWVKNNILIDCPAFYEDGTDSVSEKLRLMSSCKHFIISNSSFSWWAQYLCRNENKFVIAPDQWGWGYNILDHRHPLFQDNFITISV